MFKKETSTAESEGETILKIGQHLPKLWARIKVRVFFWTQCICGSTFEACQPPALNVYATAFVSSLYKERLYEGGGEAECGHGVSFYIY